MRLNFLKKIETFCIIRLGFEKNCANNWSKKWINKYIFKKTQLFSSWIFDLSFDVKNLSSQDGLCLGKYTLNLFNVPVLADYSKGLAIILQMLMTKSHYYPLTVDELNKATFVPKKDYSSNRLTSGLVQLSHGTHLILDETVMNNGQLNQDGIKNLTTLGQMIKFQSVDYDFGFHSLAFDTDIPCLVLSEGQSMLPNDTQVT